MRVKVQCLWWGILSKCVDTFQRGERRLLLPCTRRLSFLGLLLGGPLCGAVSKKVSASASTSRSPASPPLNNERRRCSALIAFLIRHQRSIERKSAFKESSSPVASFFGAPGFAYQTIASISLSLVCALFVRVPLSLQPVASLKKKK